MLGRSGERRVAEASPSFIIPSASSTVAAAKKGRSYGKTQRFSKTFDTSGSPSEAESNRNSGPGRTSTLWDNDVRMRANSSVQ